MSKKSVLDGKSFAKFEDLFGADTEMNVTEDQVVMMPLVKLHAFKNHPFKVKDDEKMQETVESIKANGVLVPAIVRKREDGEYELVSGHRRKHACEIVGLSEMPVIIKELSDDDATIIMVDANIQREQLDPSELAFAFKCKRDALSHKGIKADMASADEIGMDAGKSGRQVNRYIRLTYLKSELLNYVDEKKIVVGAGVELSYLSDEEQQILLDVISATGNYPNIKQAIEIKKYHEQNKINHPVIEVILKKEKIEGVNLSLDHTIVGTYFPKGTSKDKMKELIYKLLEEWKNQGGVLE